MLKERAGRSGRGVVVLDVNATSAICMDKIRDLKLYPKMVSTLKSVDIYSTQQFSNVRSYLHSPDAKLSAHRRNVLQYIYIYGIGLLTNWSRIQSGDVWDSPRLLPVADPRAEVQHPNLDSGLQVQQRLW